MVKIAILGAGQLGSRHLQGAVKSSYPLDISVIDPSSDSLLLTRTRLGEVEVGNSSTRVEFMDKLPHGLAFDIAVIATTSDIRLSVVSSLLESCNVGYLILEKVLFVKEKDYQDASKLFKEKHVSAWVNCPRRMFEAYSSICKTMEEDTGVSLTVSGYSWGLACNSIHFIDLFAFLTNCYNIEIDGKGLTKVVEGKRKGFYEIYGVLTGVDSDGNSFSLECVEDELLSVKVVIKSDQREIVIYETEGKIIHVENSEVTEWPFKPLFQSELTNLTIDELLADGLCSLTSYSQSQALHLPLINVLKKHIEVSNGESLEYCPIT